MAQTTESTTEVVDDVWKAAAYGDFDALKRFNDETPGILRTTDKDGYNCLQWAALNNRVAIVSYLIDQGVDLDAADSAGQTALHWTAVRGAIPSLETLLRAGADIDAVDSRGYTVCHVAAQYGQTSVLHHLALKWRANTDSCDVDGRSPLHWAAYKGFADTIRLLLVMGARPTLPDHEGCTPLHWAAIRGNSEACTVLLQGGAIDALDLSDDTGATPSKLAIDKGHRLLGVNLAEYRYRRDRNRTMNGTLAMLAKLHLSPIIWGIVLGMLALLVLTVLHNPHFPPPSQATIASVFMTFGMAFTGLYYLYQTTTVNPGFLPKNSAKMPPSSHHRPHPATADDVERGQQIINGGVTGGFDNSLDSPALWAGSWGQLCVSCKIVRPLRAKHCSVTERCVECYDHYCPWVGNAIGKGNRHLFLIFLWLELLAIVLSGLIGIVRIRSAVTATVTSTSAIIPGSSLALPVIFVVFDFFLLVSVAALTIAQSSQVARNVTTNELANWHRYKYLHAPNGDFYNPFDHGMKANCTAVCYPESAAAAPYLLSQQSGRRDGEQELLLMNNKDKNKNILD